MKKIIGLLIAVATVLSLALVVSGAASGVSILGSVTSYNPGNPVTIELKEGDLVKYTATIPAEEGDNLVTQQFEIKNVAAGTYDLVVTKAGHLKYTIEDVVVGRTKVDLREHSNEEISDIRLISGDINNDGSVDVKDVIILTSDTVYGKGYEEVLTKSADVNGDKCFEIKDLIIVTSDLNYNKGKKTVVYEQEEVPCVRYSDFGAVGDGVTNDFDAIIAAHAYANANGLPVFADEGATYYIGKTENCAVIRTDTTWTGATFIIDDKNLNPWQNNNILFLVDGDEYVDDFEITSLRKGQKHLGFAPGQDLLVTVENDNIRQYFRRYVNYDASTPMSDTFIVDAEGNILSDIIWNFDEITSCKAKEINDPLVIEGGTFLHKVNRYDSQGYFYRNIKIVRSNTTVQNLTMKITSEGSKGSPYSGFITVIETAYVNLKNLKLDAYNSFGGTMGTYGMQINYSANTTLDNVIQTNDILDESRWGIMNTNFCKDFVVKNCRLNRYDSHMGVTNCTIENSTIGRNGVNLIGHGDFILKDSTVYNDCLFILRADYGATWDGDIYVENVDWYHSSSCPSIIYARNDSQHDFGYTCYQPHNVYIDGLNIYEYNAPAGNNYPRILCYYVRGETIGTLSPYVLCERVVAKGVYTESGIPTYLSFNKGDYPNTKWEISDSNIVKGYLPRAD
ncbi:MAG: hypothetical protein E7627_03960 [Ruminococcaceae bacterium]|nr:hypothetical protein [Oscillospiraceae bacterium]